MGKWLVEAIAPQAVELGVELVPVALGELDLPFLDEEEHPSTGHYRHEHTRRWSALVDAADGFIAVTPEYNYGMPATLKNALDYLGREWAWKPIGFVSYGNTSAGTRSVQHAKQVVTTLRLVPLGATVAIRARDAVQNGVVRADAGLARAAVGVLDELVRLAHALRPMREPAQAGARPGPLPGSYLRRLTPDDAPEVTVLQRCCWVDEAFANETLAIPALEESLDEVRDWLATWHAWGLWRDGRLLGMVRTLRDGTDCHLGRLAVVPDLRGRGLGRWLLRAAEATAEQPVDATAEAPVEVTAEAVAGPGCERIVLFTGARSLKNIGFYQSEGYQTESSATDDGTARLTKKLTPRSAAGSGDPGFLSARQ